MEVIGLKKPNGMAMIHDMDGCKRPRLNRQIVLNQSWESSSFAQCLQRATPPFINFFLTQLLGLMVMLLLQLPCKKLGVFCLQMLMPWTKLAGTNLIIVLIQ